MRGEDVHVYQTSTEYLERVPNGLHVVRSRIAKDAGKELIGSLSPKGEKQR